MPEFLLIRAKDTRRVPWKNGRGVTEEIAVGPPGATLEAGDFAWRVSRASVAEAGPFSAFPGIDRILIVTDGAGLRLVHGDSAPVTLAPLVPHRFSGDDATTADLVGGPVRDFNVLTRRGVARGEAEVIRGAGVSIDASSADEILIHDVGAPGVAAGHALAPGDTLRVRRAAGDAATRLDVSPGSAGALVIVRIHLAAR